MKTKKTPAPQRAGTGNGKMRDRAVRETRVVKQLEWMRANDPAAFTDMMKVLARLVVRARSKQK